jgi:hypothetical protein
MTVEDVKDIRELRELLEIGALKILFSKKSKELIEDLELICNDFPTWSVKAIMVVLARRMFVFMSVLLRELAIQG